MPWLSCPCHSQAGRAVLTARITARCPHGTTLVSPTALATAKAALSSWGAALPPSFLLRGKKSQALTFNPTQPRPAPAVPSRHPVLYCSCGLREHYCRSNATGRRTGRASTGDGHCRAHLGAACRHPESPSSLQPGASCKDRR